MAAASATAGGTARRHPGKSSFCWGERSDKAVFWANEPHPGLRHGVFRFTRGQRVESKQEMSRVSNSLLQTEQLFQRIQQSVMLDRGLVGAGLLGQGADRPVQDLVLQQSE